MVINLPTDEELIEEIKNGSQAAMEVLVKKHYRSIFAYVYRKLGDYHLAYDVTQEIFIKMIKSIHNFKHKGQFKNWLLTITVNHCRDYFRSAKFKQKSTELELDDSIKDERGNVLDLLSKKIESEQMKEVIQQLPEFQREVIILRFYHDLKIKDIAYITNNKEATVRSRLKQGMQKLKNSFKGGNKDGKQEKYNR